MTELGELSSRLIDAALKAGADAADVIALRGTSSSVDARAGALEQAERSENFELGLRVLIGRRQACVSASDTAERVLADMAERAVLMAREAPEDPGVGLADPGELATVFPDLDLADDTAFPDPDTLLADALEAEAAALAVKGVSQVQAANAGYSQSAVHLQTSTGFSGGYARTSFWRAATAIAGEGLGMERDYAAESRSHLGDLPDSVSIGRLAGERAIARLGARKPPTGACPVLFDERVASSLIGHLASAINGSSIVRGSSWAAGLLGKAVLPEGMTLTEEPLRRRAPSSRAFDAEGLATSSREIVRDGVLQTWTLDLGTARKLGLASTANAARSPAGPPSPSLGNLTLTQGDTDAAGLMAEMGTGLYVTSLLGSSINPTTGHYSRGASGFWVENGEIAYPAFECTIAGSLPAMLRTLIPANDARPHAARLIPSLLVEGLTVAGA